MRGSGSYSLGDRSFALASGTLIWLVPGGRYHLERSSNLEMWAVSVRPDLIDPAWVSELAAEPSHLLSGHELFDLDRLLAQIAQDSDEPAVYNAGILYLTLRAWRACHETPPEVRPPMHPAVTRALMLLRERQEESSLSEIAAAAGVTAPYLSRLLIEHTGRNFVEWRNGIRLERFMAAYRPGVDLTRAAHAAGFGSYRRFNHVFEEMVGCAPSEWAQRGATRDDAAAAVAPYALPEYGPPPSMTFSLRQRWTRLIPLVVPVAAPLLGHDLLARLPPVTKAASAAILKAHALDVDLPAPERERLVECVCARDPDGGRELARVMEANDFGDTYAGILKAFDFSPARFADAIAALVLMLWTAINRARGPTLAEASAVRGQVEAALAETPPRLDRRSAQDAVDGLIAAFVIIFHAEMATRAGGDPHALSELASVCRRVAREVLGRDLSQLALSEHGLLPRPRSGRGTVAAQA